MRTFDDYKADLFKKDPELEKMYQESFQKEFLSIQLKKTRLSKNISQLELAKRANTTQSIVARIESWNQNISMKTLQKLLIALWATLKIELQEKEVFID